MDQDNKYSSGGSNHAAQPQIYFQGGSPAAEGSGGGLGLGTIALIGAGILLISTLNKSANPPRVNLNDKDYKFLNDNGPSTLKTLLEHDTSPVIFTTRGNEPRSDEETSLLLAALHKRYVLDQEAGVLSFPSNMLADALLIILEENDYEVRQQSLDMYVKMFDLYNRLFTSTLGTTMLGLANIVSAAGEAIVNAEECTEWTWVKDTQTTISQSSSTNTKISTKATSTKVLLGILGSGGSTTTLHNTVKSETLTESQSISFIPHCTSTQVNIAAVEGILIAQGAALKSIYDPLRAVIALAPVFPKTINRSA